MIKHRPQHRNRLFNRSTIHNKSLKTKFSEKNFGSEDNEQVDCNASFSSFCESSFDKRVMSLGDIKLKNSSKPLTRQNTILFFPKLNGLKPQFKLRETYKIEQKY